MPVRIYDIAKKLGLENKAILAKAKALGIAAARVPSSSLDKISAEFLEEELLKDYPELAAKFKAPPAPTVEELPKPPPVEEKIVVITAPPPEPPKPEIKAEPPPVIVAPKPPPPPPKPVGPKIGDKVGFIQLPHKPPPKVTEKAGPAKPPPRPAAPARGGGKAPAPLPPKEDRKAPAPVLLPKFVAPASAEVIVIKPPIVVRELATQLKQKPFKIIADLMELGVFANVNQAIDEKIAQQLCAKYGFRFEVEKRERGGGVVHAPVKKVELDVEDKPEQLKIGRASCRERVY